VDVGRELAVRFAHIAHDARPSRPAGRCVARKGQPHDAGLNGQPGELVARKKRKRRRKERKTRREEPINR